MLSSIQCRPCDTTWVLALEEEGFGLAVLKSEDLAVTADVKFTLFTIRIISFIDSTEEMARTVAVMT